MWWSTKLNWSALKGKERCYNKKSRIGLLWRLWLTSMSVLHPVSKKDNDDQKRSPDLGWYWFSFFPPTYSKAPQRSRSLRICDSRVTDWFTFIIMISILIIIISTSHVSLENTIKFSATKLFQGKTKDGAMTGHIEGFSAVIGQPTGVASLLVVSRDILWRGSEKAFNECLMVSNVFPNAA